MTVIVRSRLQIQLGESKIAVRVKVALVSITMLTSASCGRDQLLGSYSFTAPQTVSIRYESESRGLTPSERIVELRFGTNVFRVMVPQEVLNTGDGTIRLSVRVHPDDDEYFLVDLGGEALNSSRRVRVERNLIPAMA